MKPKEEPMGEVRTQAKLVNALDEELASQGKIAPGDVRTYEADALVDTGAVPTVVPAHVMQKLGLRTRGNRVTQYADGRRDMVPTTGPIAVSVIGRDMITEAMVLGDEVIIGQIVLEMLDLFVDPINRKVIPNPAHPDQPVVKVKRL
jgi:clan AA aspartic protease